MSQYLENFKYLLYYDKINLLHLKNRWLISIHKKKFILYYTSTSPEKDAISAAANTKPGAWHVGCQEHDVSGRLLICFFLFIYGNHQWW
jgi:hypothetical protein